MPVIFKYYIDVLSQFKLPPDGVCLLRINPDLTSVITKTADQARNINYFLGLNIADTPKIKSISVIIPVFIDHYTVYQYKAEYGRNTAADSKYG